MRNLDSQDKNGMIKPKGQDTIDALRDWVKKEITESSSKAYGLGKFFFGVSAGSIGAVTGLEKLRGTPKLDVTLGFAHLFFLISIFIAIYMVLPRVLSLSGDTDLSLEHSKYVKWAIKNTLFWLGTWLIGLIIGIFAVLN